LILDCCFSGDVGNLPAVQAAAVAEPFRLGTAVLGENVTVMAASRQGQTSAESSGHGALGASSSTGWKAALGLSQAGVG